MKIIADVGGTRGRWIIADKKIVKRIETPGFNPYSYKISSLEDALEILKSSIQLSEIDEIIYYGAGINNLEMKGIVRETLKNHFKNTQINVFSDLLGSCRALCNKNKGIVSILGTGSNSCYFNGEKIERQINSLGYLIGDEGSAYSLGKRFIKMIFRKELSEEIIKKFNNYDSVDDNYLSKIYSRDSHTLLSNLSKFIFKYKDEISIKTLIKLHFNEYFKEIIIKYNKKELYLTGSIAHYFKSEIREVSKEYNIDIIEIVKDPIDHLVNYHVK